MHCPTYDGSFDNERDMRIHHKLKHGESLAKAVGECKKCESNFLYYPSEAEGKICHDCSHSWSKADHPSMEVGEVKDNKRKVSQIKAKGCSRCNEDHPATLDFHHTGSNDKEGIISNLVHGPWKVLAKELKKCEVLCANCHRKMHHEVP